jgi:hypothetical protein
MAQAVSHWPLEANPRPVSVGFVVGKVTLGQFLLHVLRFFLSV